MGADLPRGYADSCIEHLRAMKLEIPECNRCCCCVPLRHGIIALGYLNLVFSLLAVTIETWFIAHEAHEGPTHTMALYRGVSFYSQMWFALLLYVMDAIFSVVLLVGAHLKKPHLLRVYFYYGITTTLASFVTLLVLAHHYVRSHWANAVLDGSMAFCGFGLQIYLLLLVRTELKKLEQAGKMSFINHVAEVIVDTAHNDEGRNPL